MENEKNLTMKMISSYGVPVVLINFIMAVAFGVILNQNWSEQSGNSHIYFELSIIFVLGLALMIGVIFYSLKKIAKTISANSENERVLIEMMNYYTLLAEKIVEGDFADVNEPVFNEEAKSKLENNLKQIVNFLKYAKIELQRILEQANAGIFDDQIGMLKCSSSGEKLIQMFNQILAKAAEKIFWYESILDAIPYPIHVLDLNGIELHMNTALEKYLADAGQYPNREAAYGYKSCEAKLEQCNSPECPDDCSVKRLLVENLTETNFFFEGMYGKMNTAYLKNKQGKNVGIVEISADITPTMSVNDYTQAEIARLEKNLYRLAKGNLDFDLEISMGNAYTTEVYEHFKAIGRSLKEVKKSIDNLIEDSMMLTNSVLKGDLGVKADEEKFSGSWKALISGMNQILTVIASPIIEVATVMDAISKGNLDQSVSGIYEGEFEKLKKSVNNTTLYLKQVMAEITEVTGKMGKGDLNISAVNVFHGDFSEISLALNKIVETLNILMNDVNIAAQQVTVGSNQVSVSSQSLAQGSTEQASSIEELMASFVEIAEQTKYNAINANAAKEQVLLVREKAGNGNQKMSEMQESMIKINQSSKDISRIIKVIDEIAFQTNILALNAAVEAARAGQHGKGFAVVAEEVRTLAARSAEAAKETTILIEDSIENVEGGTKIASETAAALTEIVNEIVTITDLMETIAKASSEQATGIAQVNTGIEMVGHVVQQNSAIAEQSAAASQDLSGQAAVLQEMIGQFELRED
ncbi:methyl-accepting chemotaxis protein [Acetobacterium wieringae]|uniref:Methyl-accepting chemotaxis protein III n=1 Tax=Acetobacterium wieringae TaxID=52694 RepID=A0A1F2PCG7_9FIRM|nr:methyl-accepting chemotaxis protein [Acetobacterium wieringae]OFV68943.1 methyl-accepting chemotaxis protein III [Acetobacterium wieringae]